MSDVRVFKLNSGEMVVAKITNMPHEKLAECESFGAANPMFLHLTQQGVALVPMMPWTAPDSGAVIDFQGSGVMGECDMDNPCHAPLLADYQRLTSRIVLAQQAPGAGNVLPIRT